MRLVALPLVVLACSGPPAVRVTARPINPAVRPIDPTLLPHWHRTDGRARVVMARHLPRWDVEVPSGACFTARGENGAAVHVTWTDPHHGVMTSWRHGVAVFGDCEHPQRVAVDADAEALVMAMDPRDEVRVVPGPAGADAVESIVADGTVIAVATPESAEGAALVYVNDRWNDHDGDGLGAELEADLGTDDTLMDTDEDGLDDGIETMGYQMAPDPPQNLPAWGASPTHKDLFVEADWEDDGGAFIGFVDGPGVIQPAADRFARLRADSIRNPDGLPGVSLHVDNGVPGGGTTWGDWGGFSVVPRQPDDTPDTAEGVGYAQDMMASRKHVFHYLLAHSRPLSGAWGYMPGDQVLTHRLSLSAFQEELGHNVLLNHHGGGYSINCKPNYHSHMNYAFNGDFSDGRFLNAPLNPLHLDETRGLGVPAADVAYLTGPPFFYTVRADGAIDWNRDGRFDTDTRAWLNYPVYFGFSCEQARYRVDGWNSTFGLIDEIRPALARVGGRIVVLYGKNGKLAWRSMTDFVNCQPDVVIGCGNWTAEQGTSIAVDGGLVAAELGGQLHVIVSQGGKLLELAMGADGPPRTVGSLWAAGGDPGLAADGDELSMLYPDELGRLTERRWNGSWSAPVTTALVATDGTGCALARGTIGNDPTPVLRAATVIDGVVTILRRDNGEWTQESDAFTTTPGPTDRAPGLAFSPGPPGRWYLYFRATGATKVLRMDFTDADGRFAYPAFQDNVWSLTKVAPSAFYDPQGGNVRLVRTGVYGELLIWPYADGLFDTEMHDVDDALIVRAGLCAALKGCGDPTCPPAPAVWTPCGGTQPTAIEVRDWPDPLESY